MQLQTSFDHLLGRLVAKQLDHADLFGGVLATDPARERGIVKLPRRLKQRCHLGELMANGLEFRQRLAKRPALTGKGGGLFQSILGPGYAGQSSE